jgi:hypothetical protein
MPPYWRTQLYEYRERYAEGELPNIDDIEAIENPSDRHEVIMLAYSYGLQVDYERHQVARMDRTDRFHVLLFAYDEKQIVPDFEGHRLDDFEEKHRCLLMKLAYNAGMAPDYRLHGLNNICDGRRRAGLLMAAYKAGLTPDRDAHHLRFIVKEFRAEVLVAAYKAGLEPIFEVDMKLLSGCWARPMSKPSFIIAMYDNGLQPTAEHLVDLSKDSEFSIVSEHLCEGARRNTTFVTGL